MLRVKSLLSSATSARRGRSADRSVSKTVSLSPHSRSGGDLVIAQSAGVPEKPRVPVFDELQKRRIRVTWAVIEAELGHVGILHFSSLLEHKLEFKMCFDKLKDMDAEELRCSPLVQMHGMSILHVLEQLINRLDDTKSWDDIIAQLARRHVGLNAKPRLARVSFLWLNNIILLIMRSSINLLFCTKSHLRYSLQFFCLFGQCERISRILTSRKRSKCHFLLSS